MPSFQHEQIQKKKLVKQYYQHDQAFQEGDHTKNFGVSLILDTTWEAHINAVTSKESRTLGLLRRVLKIAAKSVREQVYKSFVRPLLRYACFV